MDEVGVVHGPMQLWMAFVGEPAELARLSHGLHDVFLVGESGVSLNASDGKGGTRPRVGQLHVDERFARFEVKPGPPLQVLVFVPGTAPPVDYDALDPGIRDIVRKLNDAGWVTTDSGDGVSKPREPGEVLDFPHVAVATTPGLMVANAYALRQWLTVEKLGGTVEATYSPDDGTAVLFVRWDPPAREAAPVVDPEVIKFAMTGPATGTGAWENLVQPVRDDALVAAVCKAVVEENLRWHGFKLGPDGWRRQGDTRKPQGFAKVYERDVERYVRVGIAAVRAHEKAPPAPPGRPLLVDLAISARLLLKEWARWSRGAFGDDPPKPGTLLAETMAMVDQLQAELLPSHRLSWPAPPADPTPWLGPDRQVRWETLPSCPTCAAPKGKPCVMSSAICLERIVETKRGAQ